MSYSSDSDSFSNSCNYKNHKKEHRVEYGFFIKKNKLIHIRTIGTQQPFKYNLSFLQRDRYIYEFGYLLKTKYPELEEQWRELKNLSDQYCNKDPCEGFDNIDVKFIKGTLTLGLHLFAVNILSGPFEKLIDSLNRQKNDYYINNRIKSLTNEFYIYHKTKDIFKNKFLVDLDYSSYVYNERTKLYSFNKTKLQTIQSLKKYISVFKKEIESVYDYFDHPINIKIMDSILNNMESNTVLDAILDMIKKKIKFSFNNENKFEIAYQDKVLNLKFGTITERTCKHHFTTSVNARYLKKYNQVPEYIKSVFGNDKEILTEIQKLLGSLLTACVQDKFILFYGKGSNSKSKLLNVLEEILNGFHFNMNYQKYIREKDCDELIEKYNFKERRIISLDVIDCKTILKDESVFKRLLSNRPFNFIGTTNEIPKIKDNISLNRRLVILNFPYTFVNHPNEEKGEKKIIFDLEINHDFLFTWLVKGAFDFLISYTEDKKLSKVQLEAMKTYGSDDSFSDLGFSSPEEEEVSLSQVVIKNSIIDFVKEHTRESPNGKTNKKNLYELYCKENGINIFYKEFNKIIRDLLKLKELKCNNMYYWSGIRILK